ncbi:MAG TPA: 50S ribosomal protein L18 [Spirochaetota bacterium]|nr:50S ribosomal protein L18 [Spirochaetota bacterium]HPJ36845.1 50S ribosomal protein L18 [Spirochaetota bacterium]HPQ51783.1 50S ribosomal protein L18 [Spirochaetota bacterium]
MDRLRLKSKRYLRRRKSVKSKIRNNYNKLRLCISKSNKNIFAQIIDDTKGHTMVSVATNCKDFEFKNKKNLESAAGLGKLIAEKAAQKGIKEVVFDRNGYLYHGKVKAFADAAREGGLEF